VFNRPSSSASSPRSPGQSALSATETLPNRPTKSATLRTTQLEITQVKVRNFAKLGHGLMAAWAVGAAIATASQTSFAEFLDRHVQSLYFELRGPVRPPASIIILAMDQNSLEQSEFYASDPQKYAYYAPIQSNPWRRAAYAQAIDHLMRAGAKAVSLDVVLENPSAYGPQDDQALKAVLKKYGDRVTFAAVYEDDVTPQGDRLKLTGPNRLFNVPLQNIGFVNYPIAPNGGFYAFGSRYPQLVAQTYPPNLAPVFLELSQQTPSFAESTLRAAQIPRQESPGQDLFFYGPHATFPHIPFWQILDPQEWWRLSQSQTFKDKIVLIGPTALLYQDFHAAPFSKSFLYPNPLTGIEIHANAIATLIERRAVSPAIPALPLQGLLVLGIVGGAGLLQTRFRRPLWQFWIAMGTVGVVGGVGYLVFTYSRLSVPIALPIGAIALSGISYFATGTASEYLRKRQLRSTLEHYSASPIVQEIISQQDDLQDLLREREQAILGKQLAGRYTITKLLGAGGFGETYIAEDTQRPGNPQCVVKQLRVASNNPKLLQLAHRLFIREAATLEKLGQHDRIPQLLAHFEEDGEFYLVQQYIPGRSLSRELPLGRNLPEALVVSLLQQLLEISEFVHSQGVIHRDVKPSNIIVRESDQMLVLIDFGAVKEIHHLADADESAVTVGIGTQGYMPNEQCAGNPRFNSDIYAIGMTGIQALIGLPPSQLKTDANGEIMWQGKTPVSHALSIILNKMVRSYYKERYQSATEVLQALSGLQREELHRPCDLETPPMKLMEIDTDTAIADFTQPWPETFGSAPSTSATEVPPPNAH
jgi:CHASE2 domain-containing sensor protein